MNRYAIYERSTGRILRIALCMENTIDMQLTNDTQAIQVGNDVDDSTHYVDEGQLTARQPYEYTVSIENMTAILTGLPAGIDVVCRTTQLTTDEEPTELEFELHGTYSVYLSGSLSHLDEIVEVTIG